VLQGGRIIGVVNVDDMFGVHARAFCLAPSSQGAIGATIEANFWQYCP
jgi:hypothetical protein